MSENGGDPKGQGRVNDPTDGTKGAGPKRREVREPAPVWTPARIRRGATRDAVDKRLTAHLVEMEDKGAPDIVFVALAGAADAVCDYIAWQGDVDAQAFHDE